MSAGPAARRPARLLGAVRLTLAVQSRSYFPHIYFGLALLTIAAFRLTALADFAALLVPAFLLGEPGSLGVYLVAAQRYLERNEGSVTALRVTPLRRGEAVAAPVLATGLLGTAAGASIHAGVIGVDWRVLALLPPLFLTVTLSGLLGFWLSIQFREFTRFILGSALPILVFSLPLFSYFGLAPRWAFVWVPSDFGLAAFAQLARGVADPGAWVVQVVALLAANLAGGWWVGRALETRLQAGLEYA